MPALWAAVLGLALAPMAGCHLGRPPSSLPPGGVRLDQVLVAAAEPGLADDLRAGLQGALAARGISGSGACPLVLEVLEASTQDQGVDATLRVQRARLRLQVQLLGPSPRRVVLTGERSYEAPADDGLATAQARAAAWQSLSQELADDAVLWLQAGVLP